jgi:2-phosphosulfolactate phosphatase
VIRAFTTAKVTFDGGAECIFLAADREDAELLARSRGALLAGEIDAVPIAGFDLGNSPSEASGKSVSGREIVQMTTNGTRAVFSALLCAPEVVATGLSNAVATAAYVAAHEKTRSLLLIASHPTGDDDEACCDLIASLLGEQNMRLDEAVARILLSDACAKFLDDRRPEFPKSDIQYCTRVDAPEYAMVATLIEGRPCIRPRRIQDSRLCTQLSLGSIYQNGPQSRGQPA